jgi:hypothetical protein
MEYEGIYVYHESGHSLKICQWCGGPCFEGAEISRCVSAANSQAGQA